MLILGVTSPLQTAWSATAVDLRHQSTNVIKSLFSSTQRGSSDITLEQVSQKTDFNQTLHVRMKQKFKGYPVFGSEAVMHIPNSAAIKKGASVANVITPSTKMNGTVYQGLALDLANVKLNDFTSTQAEQAMQYAINVYLKSKPAPWSKRETNKDDLIDGKKQQLIVYVDKEGNHKGHMAYLVEFSAYKGNALAAKPTYIVDAKTFAVYKAWDNLQRSNTVKGGGYGGNVKTRVRYYDGENSHLPALNIFRDDESNTCYLKNDRISIKDLRDDNDIVSYKCDKTDGEHGDVYWNEKDESNKIAAWSPDNDAFYGAGVTYDMYDAWFGIPPLEYSNGKPMLIRINTHLNMANAFWDGDKREVSLGDGDVTQEPAGDFLPFSDLSTLAHEISHGFTEQQSNLIYSGQSGGLNESFSDMADQAAEYFTTRKNTWKVGPETVLIGEALRFMDNPRRDCIGRSDILVAGEIIRRCSIDHIKDYHAGSIGVSFFNIQYVDMHFSSGIFNKVFYLMSTASNWNTKKAFSVMVQANMRYWTSDTTFAEAACGVMDATRDYGYDLKTVSTAFSNVGISTANC